jgi:hypothetical protein
MNNQNPQNQDRDRQKDQKPGQGGQHQNPQKPGHEHGGNPQKDQNQRGEQRSSR